MLVGLFHTRDEGGRKSVVYTPREEFTPEISDSLGLLENAVDTVDCVELGEDNPRPYLAIEIGLRVQGDVFEVEFWSGDDETGPEDDEDQFAMEEMAPGGGEAEEVPYYTAYHFPDDWTDGLVTVGGHGSECRRDFSELLRSTG
jgi:hypothetical protein